MKYCKYNNLNIKLTLQDIFPYLEAFWIKKVIISNYNKIWLTIIVSDNEKSIIVIDNIPFNTSDFSDMIIVFKQVIKSKLYNLDIVKDITLKFYMEKPIFIKRYFMMDKLFIYWIIFLLFLLIFNLLSIDYTLLSENIVEELNICDNNSIQIESIKNNNLNLFIELFNKNGRYKYFPSYFLESNITVYSNNFNILEYILHQQYHVLNVNSDIMNNYTKEVHNIHYTILNDYIKEVHDIVSQYQNLNDKTLLQLTTAIEKLGK
jgi:hypothetical protein